MLHACSLVATHVGSFGGNGQPTLEVLETAYGPAFASLVYGGGIGVLVFFVLSGYLIGGRYARQAIEREALQPVTRFVRNRVLRIVPAYWVTIAVVAIVYGLWDKAQISLDSVLALAAFDVDRSDPLMPWLGQAWTLEIEAKFYVCVAVAALTVLPLVRRLPGGLVARTAVVVAPCVGWYAYATLFSDLGSSPRSFGYGLSLLLAGVAIGALEPLVRPRVARMSKAGPIGAAAALAGAAYVLGIAWLAQAVERVVDLRDGAGGLLALAVVLVVAGPVFAQWGTGTCWRALDNRPLRWIGTRSYSLYLVHIALLWAMVELLAELALGYRAALAMILSIGIPLSLAAADLLYRLVERPFLERKRPDRAIATSSLAKAPA